MTRMKNSRIERRKSMRKDPTLACLLNLVFLGTGHMYLGRVIKGLVILVIGVVLGLFTYGIGLVAVMAWSMYDAWKTASRTNESAARAAAAR